MRSGFSVSAARRLSIGLVGSALIASAVLAGTPAHAASAPGPVAGCLTRSAPAGRAKVARPRDTPAVASAVLERVNSQVAAARRELTRDATGHGTAAARTTGLPTYRVKVQIHLIRGKHRNERRPTKRAARLKIFRVLKNAYNGGESPSSTPMGIVFVLKRITVTRNERWYHAPLFGAADRQMKTRLHRGTASTLNIYVNKPRLSGGFNGLLGYSRFPWQYRKHKSQDGVTISVRSLPIPGSMSGFNLGDTVVHETGHWLGLFHTFQGGCDPVNDGVADTPAEKNTNGNYGCADLNNLCNPDDVLVNGYFDPAYNFMEYTRDECMQMFTAGQRERVAAVYRAFRYRR